MIMEYKLTGIGKIKMTVGVRASRMKKASQTRCLKPELLCLKLDILSLINFNNSHNTEIFNLDLRLLPGSQVVISGPKSTIVCSTT